MYWSIYEIRISTLPSIPSPWLFGAGRRNPCILPLLRATRHTFPKHRTGTARVTACVGDGMAFDAGPFLPASRPIRRLHLENGAILTTKKCGVRETLDLARWIWIEERRPSVCSRWIFPDPTARVLLRGPPSFHPNDPRRLREGE